MPSVAAAAPGSLARDLHRQRLQHRERQIERVLAALRDRSIVRGATGDVPAPLHHAMRDFEAELRNVGTALHRLG